MRHLSIPALTLLLACGLPAAPAPPTPADPPQAQTRAEEARALADQGLPAKALPLAREALALREAALGPNHPAVAASLIQVAALLPEDEEPAKAVALLERARTLFRNLGDARGEGEASMGIGNAVFRDLPASLEAFARAKACYQSCGDRQGLAEVLWHLGEIRSYHGAVKEARTCLLEALAQFRELKRDREQAAVLTALGNIAARQVQIPQALEYLNQALPLHRACGNTAQEAFTLVELGNLARMEGKGSDSLATLERALDLFLKLEHKEGQALAHHYLGMTCGRLGQRAQAMTHYSACRDLYLSIHEPLNAVTALLDLASLRLRSRGRNEEAQGIAELEEALERLKGFPEPSLEGTARSILSQFHARAGRYEAARRELELALERHGAAQDASGEDLDRYNLAMVLVAEGRPAEAAPLVQTMLASSRAGGMRELEGLHLRLLARTFQDLGQHPESVNVHRELARLHENLREGAFPALSESQKLALSQEIEFDRGEFMDAVLAWPGADSQARQDCFAAWLAHKGAVLEAQEHLQRLILGSKDPEIRARAEALARTRKDLAALARVRPGKPASPEASQRKKELGALRDRQEQELAQVSALFGATVASRDLTPGELAKRLPRGSVYLDFARIPAHPYLGRTPGPTRYGVFLLRPERPGDLQFLDLGPAEPVEARIQELISAMGAGRPVQEPLGALYARLIQPLEAQLKGASSFVISPAGPLNLLPFEILGKPGARSLMDRGPVSYLTAGRDLARFKPLVRGQGALALVAAPDFNLGLPPGAPPAGASPFADLPGTRAEAAAIARSLPGGPVQNLTGAQARESGLMALDRPWVLHLATHAYQLPGNPDAPGQPMLRHGLALAGANAAMQDPSREGLFCAEKVLDMDLSATSLVVLSACGSGLGEAGNAEGVFGLRRAFILAGAQTLVASLWAVPDEETRFLMERFYREWGRGRSKAEALLRAKRALRARHPHPRSWGAFVLVGNPR